jgi:Secretion system C-terminal sorting domain
MKYRLIICIFCSILSIKISAQTWQPILLGQKQIYQHSDSAWISNVLAVDSVQGSTFFLNRIVSNCDTCFSVWSGAKLYNQGQFLQKKVSRLPDNSLVFAGKDTFFLKNMSSIGETWLFDPTHQIQANVASIVWGDVLLGVSDSLKTIQLSNGTEIILSQNYGLIKFPDFEGGGFYTLIGLQQSNLGVKLPNIYDFYNFGIGDIFESTKEGTLDAGTPNSFRIREKKEVLQRFWVADTLVYSLDIWSEFSNFYPNPPYQLQFFGHDTMLLKIHPSLFPNWVENGLPYEYTIPFYDQEASRVDFRTHPFWGKIKMVGEFSGIMEPKCGFFQTYQNANSEILECNGCYAFNQTYALGLGLVATNEGCFEYSEMYNLTGFIKNGDTSGIISPNYDFTKTKELNFENDKIGIKVSPNPSFDNWNLEFSKPLANNIQLMIFNELGQHVFQNTLSKGDKNVSINAVNLPKGVYFLEIIGLEELGFVKLLKN